MRTFSIRNTRQFYVVNEFNADIKAIVASSNLGTIGVKKNTLDGSFYMVHQGQGGVTRTDIVTKDTSNIRATKAEAMSAKMKRYSLSPIHEPVAGQDYIVRFGFSQYISPSDEDKYEKFAIVRAKAGMSRGAINDALKASADKNFSKEAVPMLKFTSTAVKAHKTLTDKFTIEALHSGIGGNSIKFAVTVTDANASVSSVEAAGITTVTLNLASTAKTIGDLLDLVKADPIAAGLITAKLHGTGTSAGVLTAVSSTALEAGVDGAFIVEEVEQPWSLGKMGASRLHFEVVAEEIKYNGENERWANVVELSAATVIGNGKLVADMEYFYHGSRGDTYRGSGYPHNLETAYMVDPSAEYSFIDIDYFYQGDDNDVEKAPKSITLAVKNGASGSVYTVINQVINALETASGLTIADLA